MSFGCAPQMVIGPLFIFRVLMKGFDPTSLVQPTNDFLLQLHCLQFYELVCCRRC